MSRMETKMDEAMEERIRKRETGTCVKPEVVTMVGVCGMFDSLSLGVFHAGQGGQGGAFVEGEMWTHFEEVANDVGTGLPKIRRRAST